MQLTNRYLLVHHVSVRKGTASSKHFCLFASRCTFICWNSLLPRLLFPQILPSVVNFCRHPHLDMSPVHLPYLTYSYVIMKASIFFNRLQVLFILDLISSITFLSQSRYDTAAVSKKSISLCHSSCDMRPFINSVVCLFRTSLVFIYHYS